MPPVRLKSLPLDLKLSTLPLTHLAQGRILDFWKGAVHMLKVCVGVAMLILSFFKTKYPMKMK